MQYMGGKCRIAKQVIERLSPNRGAAAWVEPFVGGANVIDKVRGRRVAGDINKYLVALLREMQKPGFSAPIIHEGEYKRIRTCRDEYPDWMVGFAGICLSFAGKWWGGYNRNNSGRDYAGEAKRTVEKQALRLAAHLTNIDLYCCDYRELPIPRRSLIYCDPPYRGTTGYGQSKFSHAQFWEWCRQMFREGHQVFVSEYEAPVDFDCIWRKERKTTVAIGKGRESVEKIFTPYF